MTIFLKNLITLSLTTLGLSSVLVISVLAFMNSLYYEINALGLRNTTKTLFSVIGEKRVSDYFDAGTADPELISGSTFAHAAGDAYRLTLIDRTGDVLWDSQVEGALVNHLDREEVRSALKGREGGARRDSLSTGMRQIYSALPVFDASGSVAGVFRLSLTVPSFWRRISAAALPSLLFACLLVLAAFAAIFVFSRSLSASLKRLVDIAAATGEPLHELSRQTIPLSGEAQEFIALEKALRGMAAELNLRLEQARAEGSRLEAILNGMSEAVFAMDSGLMLHLVNPPARKLFSLGGGDVRRLSLLEATHSTELEQAARTVLTGNRSMEMELKLRDGQEQRFQVYAAPLAAGAADKTETCGGVVLVMADITRLVRLEQVRKDFVANVSHELRTPIQLIKGFSETLLDSPLEEAEQTRRFIGIIRKNAETMENLTNDLLTLASLEDGGRHDMEEQGLAPLFAEAVSSVELKARQKQIEIIVSCPPDLRAKLHGSFIIQALINLLDNGIKYSAENSKVRAAAYQENGELVLEVRDEGMGIPAEHLERIFERFYRVDRAHSREAGGTGLGLSIVRHIALLHNGTTKVESRAGSGSVFRIIIP